MDNVEEIKQKLDIVSVIGEYLQLKNAGVNFKANCPFHNEKTPSFFVSPERQTFHCFGCSEGGDIFTFVQKMEGLDFPEALRLLADKAGVQLERHDPRATSIKNRLSDICKITCEYWQNNLKSNSGQKAFDYIKKRGLSDKTILDFKIGYADDSWDTVLNLLKQKGFNENEIFEAGLTVKKDKGGFGYYDRFRDRVIFPIQDIHGNVIGFTARAMKEEEGAKYINTPETPIYYKGRVLYGLDKAKLELRKQDYVVVVEGNMDVITCHQAGFVNVIACSGTALTPDQIKLIQRYTNNFILSLDQDDAGQTATRRTIDLLYKVDANIKINKLISGKDPDECIKDDPENWKKSLQKAKHPLQFYIDKFLTDEILQDVFKKKESAKIVLTELSKISNKIEQEHWLKILSEKMDVSIDLLRESVSPTKVVRKEEVKTEPVSEVFSEIKQILTILLNKPENISFAQENLVKEDILDELNHELYKNILLCYNELEDKSSQALIKCLETKNLSIDKGYLDSLIIYFSKDYDDFSDESIRDELKALINSLKIKSLDQKITQIKLQLTQGGDSADQDKATLEIQNLLEQKNNLRSL
ncbi:DNA primase [Candidatus Falkowbacteria bacterium]|jgi:DNA primase|nr:DNA primase [Candidatus Falkowbacteria bacterium]MBT7007276.1 DNA primase [Candidatus Falkowbacteria bacterium]